MHCVDLGESFPTSINLHKSASIQPRANPSKFGSQIRLSITYRPSCTLELSQRSDYAIDKSRCAGIVQEPKGFVDMLAAGLSLGLHLKVAACGKKLVAVDILLIRWVWDRIRNLTTFPLSILILCHNMRDAAPHQGSGQRPGKHYGRRGPRVANLSEVCIQRAEPFLDKLFVWREVFAKDIEKSVKGGI